MRVRRNIIGWLLGVLALAVSLPTGGVEAQIVDIQTAVDYTFGEQITFTATLESAIPVESALIFFEAQGDTRTEIRQANVASTADQVYELSYIHALTDFIPRTFAWVDYRFEIKFTDGSTAKAESRFLYGDNRFEWNKLDEAPFHVYWYEGDIAFAQSVLDVAQDGLIALGKLLPLAAPKTLDIYVYADSQTMLETLHPLSPNWVAAHTYTDLDVIVVALPNGPEQYALTQQRIPHELMHIALYQTLGNGYANLPTWLNEGLASNVELYPNVDFPILMNSAAGKDSLLPISTLCKAFPRDAFNAMLSYAEAASFTRYIFDSYGSQKLYDLVNTYSTGVDCEHGIESALGIKLSQLERQWRQDTFEESAALSVMDKLLPWVVILVAVLAVPLGLSIGKLRSKPSIVEQASE